MEMENQNVSSQTFVNIYAYVYMYCPIFPCTYFYFPSHRYLARPFGHTRKNILLDRILHNLSRFTGLRIVGLLRSPMLNWRWESGTEKHRFRFHGFLATRTISNRR
jgi:hypothetical protein